MDSMLRSNSTSLVNPIVVNKKEQQIMEDNQHAFLNYHTSSYHMKIKMILPALAEAKSPYRRPIKYSLFPPLGLATLAAYCSPDDEIVLQDEHVEEIDTSDEPDIVVIQVYITNTFRAYRFADYYRKKGC